MNQEVIHHWDFDMDFNAEPNFITRSARNPLLRDYMLPNQY